MVEHHRDDGEGAQAIDIGAIDMARGRTLTQFWHEDSPADQECGGPRQVKPALAGRAHNPAALPAVTRLG